MKDDASSEHDTAARFEIPQGMMVYYLRLLKKGPVWTADETPDVERLQEAHLAYGQRLRDMGVLILNGPLLDHAEIRGVGVFRVASQAEAQTLSDADPAVRAGRLISEIHPWMIFKGILPE